MNVTCSVPDCGQEGTQLVEEEWRWSFFIEIREQLIFFCTRHNKLMQRNYPQPHYFHYMAAYRVGHEDHVIYTPADPGFSLDLQ